MLKRCPDCGTQNVLATGHSETCTFRGMSQESIENLYKEIKTFTESLKDRWTVVPDRLGWRIVRRPN